MFCQYAIITELTDLRPAATASFSLWKQSGSSSSYRFEWENYILLSNTRMAKSTNYFFALRSKFESTKVYYWQNTFVFCQ